MPSLESLKTFAATHGANVRIARRRLRGGGVNEYVMLYAYAATDEARGRQPTVLETCTSVRWRDWSTSPRPRC